MAADPKNSVQPDADEAGSPIRMVCECGATVSARAELAGKTVRCGNCLRAVLVDPYSTKAPPQAESLASDPESPTLAEIVDTPRNKCMLAPPQTADEIGRLGPYRVLKILGIGGMGVVYKAEDPRLGRLVAVKAMLPSIAEKKSAKERFLREARAAAALKHDHVVSIFQVEDQGVPYLAMEFLEGESLEDCLKREGRLPIGDVLRIGREIADGLGAAHERGLIHRDIKPANIWLERRLVRRKDGSVDTASNATGRVKILDFGLVRGIEAAAITQSGALLGTPAYMSLEQAHNERVDGRSDLYSLGVILYRMATGRMPFEGRNTIEILSALVSQTPIEPSRNEPSIPAKVNDLIMRLLLKNADARPASASEVYAALHDIDFENVPAVSTVVTPLAAVAAPTVERSKTATQTASPVLPRRAWTRRGLFVALGLAAVACIVAAVFAIPIRQPDLPAAHGTVSIESNDPNLEFVIDTNVPTIKGGTKTLIPLEAGVHDLFVNSGGVRIDHYCFITWKDAVNTVKAELLGDTFRLLHNGVQVSYRKLSATPAPVPVPPVPVPTKPAKAPRPAKAGDEIANCIGMKLVYIPPGKFLMGSPNEETRRNADEFQHEIEITKGLYMGRYAVTQEEYEKMMGTNPSHFSSKGLGNDVVFGVPTGRLPVETVSWTDAKEFCRRLGAKEGKEYRLPTEAEWEYACRAGTKTAYNVGETLSERNANCEGRKQRPIEVGSHAANAFGLYDMHGNVWQWCEDWYGEEFYRNSQTSDPIGPPEGSSRVIRGGSWLTLARYCRSAYRNGFVPSFRTDYLGFRVVVQSVD
jgi:eukaryotic-like serine/threonine-protein kinase